MKQTIFITIALLPIYLLGQQNFANGFKDGFKKGYCYKVTTLVCFAPVPLFTPLNNIKEDPNSWMDGYNRGYLAENELYNYQKNAATMPLTPGYIEPPNPIRKPTQTTGYIPPVDLELLQAVNEYKQKLFNARAKWINARLDEILYLNLDLSSSTDSVFYTSMFDSIEDFTNQLNKGHDYSDFNVFKSILQILREKEFAILQNYQRFIKPN